MSEAKIVPARAIPANIVDTLRLEGSFPPGIKEYPDRLQRMFKNSKVADGLLRLAVLVEPVDRVMGIDTAKRASRAFRVGAFLGIRVVSECVDSVDMALADITLKVAAPKRGEDDNLHSRHLIAEGVIDLGKEAFAKVKQTFGPLFDDWEDMLVPSVPHQTYLRSGFGIPIAYLHARYAADEKALRQADLEKMAAEADAGVNWDDLLR